MSTQNRCQGAFAQGMRKRDLPSLPALQRWWMELKAGVAGQKPDSPSTWVTDDPVYQAAGWEYEALQAWSENPEAAQRYLAEARQIIAQALAENKR